jgi:hypothetical protein
MKVCIATIMTIATYHPIVYPKTLMMNFIIILLVLDGVSDGILPDDIDDYSIL